MGFTAIQKALAILPKISGALSIIGSISIIQDVMRDKKKRSESMYHRLMVGISFFDGMASLMMVVSTWASPAELHEAGKVYLASGTTATCVAQGTIAETGFMATVLYTAALCTRYLLQIRFKVKESTMKRYELFFHVIPITVGVAMALVGVPLDLYNNTGFNCWYGTYPAGCTSTTPHTCTRGDPRLVSILRWVHFGLIWGAILVIFVIMVVIFKAVYLQERKASFLSGPSAVQSDSVVSTSGSISYSGGESLDGDAPRRNTTRDKRKSKSRMVACQAFLYVGSLYLTWFFTTLVRIFQTVMHQNNITLLMLMAITFPLQGFFNAFVYFRSRKSCLSKLASCCQKRGTAEERHTEASGTSAGSVA